MKNLKAIHWVAIGYGASLFIIVVLLMRSGPLQQSLRNPSIALVSIEGPIRMGNSLDVSGADPKTIIKTLSKLEDNPRIRAIVLRINSPGGSVAAVQEIYDELNRLKKKGKILVASMGDVAASGGYYLAAATNRIVANPGTLTGSIGVILELANAEELMKKVGVKAEAVKSGAFKDAGSPFRALTPKERAWFQSLIDQAYEQFLSAVMEGRKLKRSELIPLADGRVFTGQLAKEKKLVDILGSEWDAIQEAKRLTGVKDEKVPILDLTNENTLDKLLRLNGILKPFRFSSLEPTPRLEYMWE